MLPFDGAIDDAHCGLVVAMDGDGGLRVAKFGEGKSKILPSFMFKNNTPNSAAAANAAMNFRMMERMWKAPLRRMGSSSFGSHPIKNIPAAWLHPFLVER